MWYPVAYVFLSFSPPHPPQWISAAAGRLDDGGWAGAKDKKNIGKWVPNIYDCVKSLNLLIIPIIPSPSQFRQKPDYMS